jgi:hypothetical protein
MKKTLLFLLFIIVTMGASAQSWKLTGNSGLATTNFLGSTDSKDVIFKTNNIERGRIISNGSWRFGTSTNFAAIDSTGAFTFGGLGAYRVAANKYVFQYITNPNYGLFFNSSTPQYEFRNGSASAVFSINANTGNGVFNGTLKVGSYTLPATDGSNGQVLKTNGAGTLSWSSDNNTIYTAGTGINISGTTVANSAPDQVITLTGSGATSVAGAYPNFTISSTDNNTNYSAGSGINISGNIITNTGDTNPNDDANLSLSNLSVTAINQDMLPDVASSKNIGSVDMPWKNLFLDSMIYLNGSKFLKSLQNENVGIGTGSMDSIVTGSNNSAFGTRSLNFSNGDFNTAIGANAFSWNRGGDFNTSIGAYSMGNYFITNNLSGNYNTAIGAYTMSENGGGDNSTAIGSFALKSGGGSGNTAIGTKAMYSNVFSYYNVALGYEAAFSNSSGWWNVAIGGDALYSNSTGKNLVAIGDYALYNNTAGTLNTAIGSKALYSNVDGIQNTATGYQSLYSNNSGNDNIANGVYALFSNRDGPMNIAIGTSTLYSNVEGEHNIGIGYAALYNNDGSNNTAVGYQAGYSNTNGLGNQFFGSLAGYANTSGMENTFVGGNTGAANTTGSSNSFFGVNAGHLNITGSDNSFVGYWSGYSNQTGHSNVAFGSHALYANLGGSNQIAIGDSALYENSDGTSNTAVGSKALYSNTTGAGNAAIGYNSGYSNTTGSSNSFFGDGAGGLNTTAFFNTFIGYQAGYFTTDGGGNTFIGTAAGLYNTSGKALTFVGDGAGAYNTDYYESSCFGSGSVVTASYQVRIGDPYVTSIGGVVGWSVFSDGRFKRNIKENVPGLEFIKALKPITYTMDVRGVNDFLRKDIPKIKDAHGNTIAQPNEDEKATAQKEKIVYTGFIAQDVEKAAKKLGFDFSGVDAPKNDKDLYGLRYAEFVVPLVKAVQELSASNDKKDDVIIALQKENKDQQQAINELIARLDKLEQAISKCCPAAQSSVAETEIQLANTDNAKLEQNIPNPFSQATYIKYYLPAYVKQAQLLITDVNGGKLKLQAVAPGYGKVNIKAGELASGTYTYTLYADGKIVDSKKMVITK